VYGIIYFKYLFMSVEYNELQNLESAVHANNKLLGSVTVFISYNIGLSRVLIN